jgi:hypothetical protein
MLGYDALRMGRVKRVIRVVTKWVRTIDLKQRLAFRGLIGASM